MTMEELSSVQGRAWEDVDVRKPISDQTEFNQTDRISALSKQLVFGIPLQRSRLMQMQRLCRMWMRRIKTETYVVSDMVAWRKSAHRAVVSPCAHRLVVDTMMRI